MYIKRNVYFSAVDQETGEEKLFSTTEIISEEEYQKEFGEKAKNAAIGAGVTAGTLATGAGLAYGAKKISDASLNKVINKKLALEKGEIPYKEGLAEKLEKQHESAAKINNRVNKPIKAVKDYLTNAKGKAEAVAKGALDKNGKKLGGAAAKAKTEKLLAEAGKVARNRKIGAGAAVAGTIAAGAGLNVIRKNNKK